MEKGTFTQLIFSTIVGIEKECSKLNKKLTQLVLEKKGESYDVLMKQIRTRLRYALLRATLIAIQGSRGQTNRGELEVDEISFNLIPEMKDC